MNEPKLVNSFERKDTLCDVESSHVLGKSVVLDEHRHEISAGQKLHQKIKVLRVLERVIQLHNPGRVRFGQHVTFGADVRKLSAKAYTSIAE